MTIVHKYELDRWGAELPQGAEILHVATRFGHAYVWALADDTEPRVHRQVAIISGEGDLPLGKWRHINTFYSEAAEFPYHAFEQLP